MSSNAVLRSVIEDIVQCCVDGVEVTTEEGGKLVIFMELVAYIGDYPGMSHCLDILGHNASVPCTHCMFRRADLSSMEECSRYAYTSSINSSDPAYRRTKDRMRLLRAALDCEESTLQDVCSATSVKAVVKRQRANINTQTKNGSAVNRVVERVPRTAREGPEGSGRDLRETD